MIYKYRYHVSIFLFFVLLILGNSLFGYTRCKDGWNSPSIGSRGACSHHGGVTSNYGLIFITVGAISFFLFSSINSKYRVYGNIVVSAKLPHHPLEDEVKENRQFSRYPVPTGEAKSRKSFQCNLCKASLKKGTVYKYLAKGNYRIKYCVECALKLPSVNRTIKSEEDEYRAEKLSKMNEIKKYYEMNAKALLN